MKGKLNIQRSLIVRLVKRCRAQCESSLLGNFARFQTRVFADERGDVPGWVLVTVMTAGLVTAIWLVADTQLKAVLERAMASLGTK